jgi:hypothetical protein
MVKIIDLINYLILALVFVALLSVIKYVHFVFSVLLIVILGIFIFNEKKKILRLNRKVITIFAYVLSIFIFINSNLNSLILTLSHILIIFISVKLLEEKGYRDYMQIVVLCVFLITISGLFDLSMIFLFYILLAVFIINILVVLITVEDFEKDSFLSAKNIKTFIIKSSLIPLLALPVSIVIFVILPRTSYPLFGNIGLNTVASSGFSSKVSLGDVNSIQEDNRIAFRVVMKKVDYPLYFRGVVFDKFEGSVWKSEENGLQPADAKFDGEMIEYEMYLEPHFEKYLITVDYPYTLNMDKRVFINGKLEAKVKRNIDKKVRYAGISYYSDRIKIKDLNLEKYLDTSQIPNKIRELALRFIESSPVKSAENIEKYLKSNYQYSLAGLSTENEPVEDFLFKTKKGNCEYFASAMALLLRVNNIPARLVGGFKGGFYNERGGYYAVANKNAHVWVEAYIDEAWTRFDPTPAAIENFTNSRFLPVGLKIRLYFDYISYYWTKFVINYDFQKQLALYKNITLKFKNLDFKTSGKLFLKLLGVVIVIFFVVTYLKRKEDVNEGDYYVRRFYKLLKKKNIRVDEKMTLMENVDNIDKKELKSFAEMFVGEFYRMKFKENKLDNKRLNEIIKQCKKIN